MCVAGQPQPRAGAGDDPGGRRPAAASSRPAAELDDAVQRRQPVERDPASARQRRLTPAAPPGRTSPRPSLDAAGPGRSARARPSQRRGAVRSGVPASTAAEAGRLAGSSASPAPAGRAGPGSASAPDGLVAEERLEHLLATAPSCRRRPRSRPRSRPPVWANTSDHDDEPGAVHAERRRSGRAVRRWRALARTRSSTSPCQARTSVARPLGEVRRTSGPAPSGTRRSRAAPAGPAAPGRRGPLRGAGPRPRRTSDVHARLERVGQLLRGRRPAGDRRGEPVAASGRPGTAARAELAGADELLPAGQHLAAQQRPVAHAVVDVGAAPA